MAAFYDITTTKIPNWISGILIVTFLVIAPFIGFGFADIGLQLAIGLSALLIGFLLFSMGVFGGGDAKLIAAALLWMNASSIIPFLFFMALTGGLLGVLFLFLKYMPLPKTFAAHPWGIKLKSTHPHIPYGLAIAMGGILAYPQTVIFTTLISL